MHQTGRSAHVAWQSWGPDDEAARADALPVLLLHGVTDSGGCWPAVVAHLAPERLVVTLDARGHGRSGLPDEPFTVAALADEAAGVLREVVGRPALVVGHSMGGLTAEELALTHPDLVAGVVLEDPAWIREPVPTPSGVPAWLPESLITTAERTRAELETWSRAEHPGWADDEHAPWAQSSVDVSLGLLDVPHEWAARDWVEALADVHRPVTLVTGDPALGALVDDGHVARAAELLGRAPDGLLTHVAVPGVGHSVRREDRAAFLACLDDTLDRLG